MTTISLPEQASLTLELSTRAVKAVATAKDLTWGWGKIAQFLSDNPDIAARADTWREGYVLVYLAPGEDTVALLAEFTRRGIKAGGKAEKAYDDKYGMVKVHFGPVHVQFYSVRSEVCQRVVVGTREVVEEVQDPEALAAVPTVKQTRVEEIIEWQCRPILAGEQLAEVTS